MFQIAEPQRSFNDLHRRVRRIEGVPALILSRGTGLSLVFGFTPRTLQPRESDSDPRSIGRWVGPSACLDVLE